MLLSCCYRVITGVFEPQTMSQLMIAAFDDKHRADEVLLHLLKLEQSRLSALEDAVVVTKNAAGKIRVKAYHDLLRPIPELSNDLWGGVISAIVFHRTLNISHEVFDPSFLSDVEEQLQPNSSALMVLAVEADSAAVEEALSSLGGKLLKTMLPDVSQQKIQASII